jgi:predicted DNA-binding transcriptional regulator YafY
MQSKTWHILNITKKLENGEIICTKEYATIYEKAQRSIQRYFEKEGELFEFYGDKLIKDSQGCYKLINEKIVNELLFTPKDTTEFERIIDLYYMINPAIFDKFDEQTKSIINKYYQKTKECYQIKQTLFEPFCNSTVVTNIKNAIKYKKYSDITYETNEKFYFKDVKLYKIVFIEGNWYVACEDINFVENNGFRWLRLSFIKYVTLNKKTFHKNPDVLSFILNFQSLFTNFLKERYSVKVKIDKEIARFFEAKKHLKSQQNLQKNDDGSLIAEFQINNKMEIMPLVKKWLPHIHILEPNGLKEQFDNILTKYIAK